MPISRHEWQDLTKRVRRLANPVANASTWAAASMSVAVTFLVSGITILGGTRNPAAWLVQLHIWATVCFLVIGFFSLWVHSKTSKRLTDDVGDLVEDMEKFQQAHPPVKMPKVESQQNA